MRKILFLAVVGACMVAGCSAKDWQITGTAANPGSALSDVDVCAKSKTAKECRDKVNGR